MSDQSSGSVFKWSPFCYLPLLKEKKMLMKTFSFWEYAVSIPCYHGTGIFVDYLVGFGVFLYLYPFKGVKTVMFYRIGSPLQWMSNAM